MLGYDWPRLHAALNDLPAALIVTGALIALIDQFMRRDSLRAAGYWMIVLGWVGTIGAVIAGLRAEGLVAHGGDVHEAFSRHKTLGLITLGVVTVVALWRVARERKMGLGEQSFVMGLTLAAAGLVVSTSQIGGDLVYDHALGIETPVLRQAIDSRAAGHDHADGASHTHDDAEPHEHPPAAVDSVAPGAVVPSDTSAAAPADHEHAPGTPAHDH
jgi:uncharacterized membrane protein